MNSFLNLFEKPQDDVIRREQESRSSLPLWAGVPMGSIFTGLASVIVVRCVLEAIFENQALAPENTDFYGTLVAYSHITISWLCLFTTFAVAVAMFMDLRLTESFKIVLLCSPLIILVPILDYIVSGGAAIDYGENFSDFLYNYVNLFNPVASIKMVSLGVRVEVFFATTGSFLVSFLYFKKSLIRSLFFAISLYTIIFSFGYLPAIMPFLVQHSYLAEFPLYLPVFILLMVFIFICLRRDNRDWANIIMHLLFPSRLLFYILLLSFGMIFTAKANGVYPKIFLSGGMINLFLASASIVLLFVHAKIKNDFYDRDIDMISNPGRDVVFKAMPAENVCSLANILLLPSFIFGLAAHRYFFPLWLLILALCSLYSEPPMRLRRFYPIGHIVLSMVGASVFMAGAVLAGSGTFFTINDVPKMTICVFVGFFFLSHIKDLKDIEGDRFGGVVNVYNLTKSPKAICVAAICSFATVLVVDLSILSIYGPMALAGIGVYLAIALGVVSKTADLRRLDWLLFLSWVLVLYISAIWLTKA